MEYYSAVKKNGIMPFAATWMDLDMIILSEVSQTKTNIIRYRLYVEPKVDFSLIQGCHSKYINSEDCAEPTGLCLLLPQQLIRTGQCMTPDPLIKLTTTTLLYQSRYRM